MSDHRCRGADQGRRADRGPAGRDERRRTACSRRCTNAPGPAGRVVRTSLLAWMVGVHAFQGTRWTVAGEVPGRIGHHHPAIAPYGCSRPPTPVQVACGQRSCGSCSRRGSGWTRPTSGSRRNASGSRTATLDRRRRGRVRRRSAEDWLARLPRPGSRPARCARSTTSTPGSRPVPGPAARGRPPDARPDPAARLTDPLRGQPLLRRHGPAHGHRRRWCSTTGRIRDWLDLDPRVEQPAAWHCERQGGIHHDRTDTTPHAPGRRPLPGARPGGDVLEDVHPDDLSRSTPCARVGRAPTSWHPSPDPVNMLAMARGDEVDWSSEPPLFESGWAQEFRNRATTT